MQCIRYWPGSKETRASIRFNVDFHLCAFESAHLITEEIGVLVEDVLECLLSYNLDVVDLLPVKLNRSQPVSAKNCWAIGWPLVGKANRGSCFDWLQ